MRHGTRYSVLYRLGRDGSVETAVLAGDTREEAQKAAEWHLGMRLPSGEPAPGGHFDLGPGNGNWRCYVAIRDNATGEVTVLRDAFRKLADSLAD